MSTETMIQRFPLFINGQWTPVENEETFDVVNPANSKVVAKVAKASEQEVEVAVRSARETFESGVWFLPEDYAEFGIDPANIPQLIPAVQGDPSGIGMTIPDHVIENILKEVIVTKVPVE